MEEPSYAEFKALPELLSSQRGVLRSRLLAVLENRPLRFNELARLIYGESNYVTLMRVCSLVASARAKNLVVVKATQYGRFVARADKLA